MKNVVKKFKKVVVTMIASLILVGTVCGSATEVQAQNICTTTRYINRVYHFDATAKAKTIMIWQNPGKAKLNIAATFQDKYGTIDYDYVLTDAKGKTTYKVASLSSKNASIRVPKGCKITVEINTIRYKYGTRATDLYWSTEATFSYCYDK